ncbi:Ig-like domain-containing protein [Hafnia alvei]|uniref:Ig-like domain-containing protein n=1 Tax=Hafnia alvei TaxID=569 RepID=UPI0024A7AC5C|nr:invasin domain 3-containing protein [Hafnia alvei]
MTGLSSATLSGMVAVANADAKSKANWVESATKGTYVGTYVAKAAGTGLKATLTIGSGTKDSATYAITAGDAVLANSTIARDSDSYVSGADIQVTVTLKDGNTPTANPVTGLSNATLAGMVAVANADAKSSTNWVESATKGTYVGIYVARAAGTGLKATLTIGSATKDSATYAITAGDAVLANSTITRDSDSYVSGKDIQVTVTLKDGNTPTANPVTGLSSATLAGMVTVANADAKSKTNWVESATKGTYVGTYVAKAAGTGLKAVLTISGVGKDSATYAITAGDAVLANSTITRDSDSYVSGKDIQVTVTLKDGNTPTANPVTGLSSATLAGMVTVANADAKSKTNWVESATKGTYVGTYVAKAAGTGLKAVLTISGVGKDSATYAITAGDAVLANSTITRDSDSYVSGKDIQVTVTLKDGNTPTANPVTGLSSATLASMVTVANADAKSKTNWVESATKGTYVGTYVAKAAGTGLKAVLTISGVGKDSATYAITAGDAVLANSTITRDSDSYVSGADIKVTVTLKDGNTPTANPVTGLSSATLAGMVTVANADAKSKTNWAESATKGTYVGTYVAKAAGTGLKAVLTIGSATKDSATYAITAGNTVLANSTITLDSDSYVSGADIKVTVTLKDGNTPTANPVKGLSSATLAGMVTVANADAKTSSNWTEVADKPGTYTGLYVARAAGTELKAVLTIGSATKDSATYAITAGDAVLANSTIARDSDSYVSGADIQVTVTLKDGNTPTANPVTGLSSATLAGMVTVANADAKSKTNWAESATKGTYVGTYVAKAAGTGLKAVLTIGSGTKDSATYVITAGNAVLANSTIIRDSDSYISGADIQVTVTLKDGNTPTANPVTGLSSATLSDMVTVANADAKSKTNWVESATKGTYVGIYVARAAGTGLKATLTIGSATKDSATYAITAGDAVLANSTIARDSDSYISGADIKVTVTLKDGNTPTANPVTGLSSATLSGMVAVANADAKSKANWVESATKGTYVGTYVARAAGTGLKAVLTIGSATKDSATYAITAGDAVLANSTITRDSDSYVSGSDIQVTVTLKDGNTPTANPVTGLSSATLSDMVTVANTDAKTSTNWVESATKGTYVGTYVAKAAGTGLKAVLTIGSGTKDSATYVITAGNAVLANSTIIRDSDSYVSGADIQVTVTLKDGNTPTANPVTGLSSATLSDMVTVANTDAKTSTNWVESATKGTYVGTYVARAAGTGLKAVLTIGSGTKDSATYAITAGDAVLANSTIARDSDSYVSGADIQVTVTLKDGNTPTANPVTGLSSATLAGMVTVANADAKTNTNWVESATKGTYTGTYVAKAAGTGLKAVLTIGSGTKDSTVYAITAGDAVLANSTITRDSDSYVSGADIKIMVTLKDGNTPTANPVTGLSSATLAGMVTVANADAKSKTNWVESATKGTYEGAFVARAAGTSLKSTLTIGSATKDSTVYAITAGDAVLANSTITRDSDSYVSGADIKVTVTLNDGNTPTANPVTGLSSATLSSMVAVANTDAKSKANWTEVADKPGTYTGLYVAKAAGANLKAILSTESWEKESATYSIVADVASAHVDTVTLSDDVTTKVANGTDFFTYNALVIDLNDNPVGGVAVTWSQDKGEAVTLSDSTSTTNGEGVATITLKSTTTLVANVGVSAQYAETAKKDANHKVTFTYGEPASVTVNTTDNATTAVVGTQPALTIAVLDSSGHQLPSKTVSLAVSGLNGGSTNASVYPTSVSSNADGEISANPLVADTTAQVVTITASLTGSDIKGTLDITFNPDVVSANTSTIIASPASIAADTVSTSLVTYVAKDRYGNIISSIDDSSMTSAILGMSESSVTLGSWSKVGEGSSTKYMATITAGQTVGSLKVIPIVNGQDGVSRTGNNILTLVPGPIDINESSISATPDMIIADGRSTSTLRFIPRDRFKNVVDTIAPTTISQVFSGEATDESVGQWAYRKDSKWYEATLTAGIMPGSSNIMPTVAGNKAASQGVTNTLTLKYSSSVKDIDTKSTGTAIADGSQTNQVTVTVYGENETLMSNIDVTITPSNDELLVNGTNKAFTKKTNDQGQITVSMASTVIGSNSFTVESDQYSEVGNTAFGVYVSPTLSSINFDKKDLFNNGTDKMTVTFNPRDAKNRDVEGLSVSFSSSDSAATLVTDGYHTTVSSRSSPSTYFITVSMGNYAQWSPDDQEYQLIPISGVLIATLTIQPKLCATTEVSQPFSFDKCTPSDTFNYRHSGLGFVVEVLSKNALWDNKLGLFSDTVTGELLLVNKQDGDIKPGTYSNNCSQDVTSSASWMNDFARATGHEMAIDFTSIKKFDTYSLGFAKGGVGSCEAALNVPVVKYPAVNPYLQGKGGIVFEARTQNPEGISKFEIPISDSRIDKGLVGSPMKVYIYGK